MKEVIDTYDKVSKNFIGNSNSLHNLGINSKKLENEATRIILNVLGLTNREIIYTSGTSENYSLILNNVDNDKKIVTDNKKFYEIGKEMYKNIVFDKELKIDSDTYLISTINDLDLSNYKCLKHIQLKNKMKNYNNYDFISMEEIPFFGCLIKTKNKNLKPIIHGGKSTTVYRSGTSPTPLIASLAKIIKIKYKK